MKKKKAFNIAELMISFIVIIVILALVSPVLKNKMMNTDRTKLKHAYGQLLSTIEALSWDTAMFPDTSGFANISATKDSRTGEVYSGANKFTQLFMNKLNIVNENVSLQDAAGDDISIPSACENIEQRNTCDIEGFNTVCFTNSAKVTYCLDQAASQFFRQDKSVVVRLFLGDSYTEKDGYYFAVSKDGKVDVLPIEVAFGSADFCATPEMYSEYKHCKTNDFLRTLND